MDNNDRIDSESSHTNKFEIPKIEKKLGDVKISEKNYEEALHHYKNSIMAIKILFDEESSLETDEKKATELIEEVGIPVHLNIAFCFLNMEDWKNVVFYCNKVLELKPDNLKALYRRCRAYIKLKDLENAEKDIEKLEKELPSTSEELKFLKKSLEEIEKENRGLYQNIGKKIVNKKQDDEFQEQRIGTTPSLDYINYYRNIITTKLNYSRKKCNDLIIKLPDTGRKAIVYGLNLAVILPLKIAVQSFNTAKNILIDIPIEVTYKAINVCFLNPVKFVFNRLISPSK